MQNPSRHPNYDMEMNYISGTNQMGNNGHTQRDTNLRNGDNTNNNNQHFHLGDHKWATVVIQGVVVLSLLGLALGLGLGLGLRSGQSHDGSSAKNGDSASTNPPISSLSTIPSLLQDSYTSSTNPAGSSIISSHPPAAAPTMDTLLSAVMSSMDSSTRTPVPLPTTPTPPPQQTTQPDRTTKKATKATTSPPAYLTPGATCTADSQCSPNICYKQATTSYCCGTNLFGCPGSPCTSPEHLDCLDPYKCDSVASTCVFQP